MKKNQKKQILDLMRTMQEANQRLMHLLKMKDFENITLILAEEQEAAISIGNRIEESEGEDIRIVSLLEEYCEFLWKITQEDVIEQKKLHIGQLELLLRQSIEEMEELKETEQIDVLFLPYNASMWDSMETVWKAAREDCDCNTCVMPIPYYEVNSDGTLGEMHYEGGLFPKDVPIVSYQEYDLKKQHPDVIYIHNPYDEYNRVTRVHSDFYSSALRNYTDILVYIPYYITNGQMPETHSYLPAYIYADKIVLQTHEMMEDIHPDIPRDRLLALGSPKAERIVWMETHKDQIDFPDEWKKKSEGKKVIFYNVSISGMLKYQEKMLDKMEEVFRIVESYKDIMLLWRPHPLLETTLTSMCGNLIERYRRLMRWYKKKNIGILDLTADPGKAVVFADAYIGESTSSIVDLFRTVNKPRLFMTEKSYYQPTLDEMLSETTYDVCKVGDEVWFVTTELQMLCKFNLKDKELKVVAAVPEAARIAYVYIAYYNGKIVLVPDKGEALCIYDIKSGCFTKRYFLDEHVERCFGGVFVYKNYLYLTPKNYPALVQYDIINDSFQYFSQCISDMMKEIGIVKSGTPFLWGVCQWNTKLFISTLWSSHVLIFDMETYAYQIEKIEGMLSACWGMSSDEKYNWFINQENPQIVRWNRETHEVREYGEFPKGFEAGSFPFKRILDFGEKIYLIPCSANHICQLDKATGIISYPEFNLPYAEGTFASEYYREFNQQYLYAKKISDTEMILMSLYDNRLLVIDVENGNCKSSCLRIDDRIYWELQRKGMLLTEMYETKEMPIVKYFECIKQELEDRLYKKGALKPTLDTENHVGENIHQNIKKLLKYNDGEEEEIKDV